MLKRSRYTVTVQLAMVSTSVVAFLIVIRCISAIVGLRLLRGEGMVLEERERFPMQLHGQGMLFP